MDSLQSVVPAYLKTFWEHYGIIFKAGLLGFSNLRHGRVKTMVQIWVAIEINIKVLPEHKHGKGEIKIVHGNVTTTFPFLVFHSNGLGFDNEKWTRICGFAVHERLINTSGTLLAASSLLFFLFAKLLHAELKHVVLCNCAGWDKNYTYFKKKRRTASSLYFIRPFEKMATTKAKRFRLPNYC